MAAALFLSFFAFALGAVVGSFLNVVVYRLPLGKSLVTPPSNCPQCKHPIRWYDNVPILSWLWLRGRCRDCGATIAARYPLVEAGVGLLFVALAWTDVILPYNEALAAGETDDTTSNILLLRMFYHLILLCPLLAVALIEHDGGRFPRQLITWPTAVGILLAIFTPAVLALPLNVTAGAEINWLDALCTAILGMAAAVVLRLIMLRTLGVQRSREVGLLGASLALYGVGALLGWQAVLCVALAAVAWTLLAHAAFAAAPLARVPATTAVFTASLVWSLCERQIATVLQ